MTNQTEQTDFEIECTIKSAIENSGTSQKTGQPYTNYIFEVIDNTGNTIKMSTFEKKFYEAWKPGDRVTCQYRKSGIYNQLVGFEELDDGINRTPIRPGTKYPEKPGPQETQGSMGETYTHKPTEKDKWIVRQNTLHRAVEMYIAGLFKSPEDMYKKAEEMEKWVLREDFPDY